MARRRRPGQPRRGGCALAGVPTVLAVLALAGVATWWAIPKGTRWEAVARGVEYRRASLPGDWLSPRVTLHAFRVDLTKARLLVADSRRWQRRALTAAEFRRHSGAVLAINGGFFDDEERPVGLLISDGVRTSALGPTDSGVFAIRDGEATINHRTQFTAGGVTQAVQSGPRLVVDGRPLRLRPGVARRSAVAIDADGRVLLMATEGPVELAELAKALAAPARRGGFGARTALNLDGGPSTQLSARAGRLTVDVAGGTPVPSAILVAPTASPKRRASEE